MNFYIEVLNTHHQSEDILANILTFCLSPYKKEFRLMVDMDYYILQLKKINPNHPVLKEILERNMKFM